MRNRVILLMCSIVISVTGVASATMIDFEDLTLGSIYNVGDSFTTKDVTITGETFFWGGGDPYNGGFTEVEDGKLADGSGNELEVNNINLNFDFGTTLDGLALQFGEYGGNLNIEINGDFVNFNSFAAIDDTGIGDTLIFVAEPTEDDTGALFVVGTINSFVIGGQELWIDNIVTSVPEPATFMLLILGAMLFLRKRLVFQS